jgi:N utilization substance protein A
LSRTCPELLIELFKSEVPEVAEEIVQIKGAAREPGIRAKMAVMSSDPDVDPVGACVGVKGARVQNVVQELRGEKIDIVPWDADETRFVCNALAPAEVSKVVIDEYHHSMEIVVADNQLSLAIGKRGQNVKLASNLTGWKLDILSETKMGIRQDGMKAMFMSIEGMTDTLAQSLYHYGYTKVDQLLVTDVEQLKEVPGFTQEKAIEVKANAQKLIESGKLDEMRQHYLDLERKASQDPNKMSADAVFERLKAEVKAHEEKEKSEEVQASVETE